MVLDVHDAPQHLLQPVTADIRRLTEPVQLADVVAVLEPVWMRNFDWVYERMGREMTEPGYLSMYVAYVEDRPVSVGWTHFHEGHFASLWGGSTLESMRGRGLYTALLATRVQEAIARGKRFVTLDAGSMSRPIVARYGFFELTTAVACEWRPEAQR
ncbi:MAG: GNAT family N-acetyltransferase [Chloroflexota bacterium]